MTTLPNTLAGASTQLPETCDRESVTSVAQPTLWPETFTKNRLKPETLMVALLAIWMVLAVLIVGFTAVSY